MVIQQYWRREIEKHGGKVANTAIGISEIILSDHNSLPLFLTNSLHTRRVVVAGVTCLVVSPMERERGGSSKVTEAV